MKRIPKYLEFIGESTLQRYAAIAGPPPDVQKWYERWREDCEDYLMDEYSYETTGDEKAFQYDGHRPEGEEFDEWCNRRWITAYKESVETLKNVKLQNGKYRLWRAMLVTQAFLDKLISGNMELGRHWTFTKMYAEVWGGAPGDADQSVLLEALVDPTSVDWGFSVYKHMDLAFKDSEDEIVLLPKKPIELVSIELNDKPMDIPGIEKLRYTA
jgi:hypothetical protein